MNPYFMGEGFIFRPKKGHHFDSRIEVHSVSCGQAGARAGYWCRGELYFVPNERPTT